MFFHKHSTFLFQQSSLENATAKLANHKEKSQQETKELQEKMNSEVSDLRKQLEERDSEIKSEKEKLDSLRTEVEKHKSEVENEKVRVDYKFSPYLQLFCFIVINTCMNDYFTHVKLVFCSLKRENWKSLLRN